MSFIKLLAKEKFPTVSLFLNAEKNGYMDWHIRYNIYTHKTVFRNINIIIIVIIIPIMTFYPSNKYYRYRVSVGV